MHLKNQLKSIARDIEKEITVRIAFTGSHSTGKTTAARILKEQIEKIYPNSSISLLPSVTRAVIDAGGVFSDGLNIGYDQNLDTFQLACIYLRRNWMLSQRSMNSDFIISERWALDEAAYQGYKEQNSVQSNSRHYYRVAVEEAKWEATNYWDRIYYIPVSDRGVEDDGVRPLDKEYQEGIDHQINRVLIRVSKSIIIKEVPLNIDELESFFEEEVKAWKK